MRKFQRLVSRSILGPLKKVSKIGAKARLKKETKITQHSRFSSRFFFHSELKSFWVDRSYVLFALCCQFIRHAITAYSGLENWSGLCAFKISLTFFPTKFMSPELAILKNLAQTQGSYNRLIEYSGSPL